MNAPDDWHQSETVVAQQEICTRLGVTADHPDPTLKAGIAAATAGLTVNGLRHPAEPGTTGWFLWAGETFSTDADFFQPMHLFHVVEWRPEVIPYLALPPGWRFLIAPGCEDVWYDHSVLDI